MYVRRKMRVWLEHSVRFLTRTWFRRVLVMLSLPAVLLYIAFWQPHYSPPIFDAQVHYNEESWRRVSVDAVLHTSEEINVPWLLVASIPNDGTWQLYYQAPQRVIPMLVPAFSREDLESWFNDEKIAAYLETELQQKPYRGIGEFFLYDGQVDTPVVRRMVELAVARDLVLHARSDPLAIRQLFELGPGLRIIWAHAGIFTQPDTIGEMLERYPALWVDISLRGDVAPRGALADDWRELMSVSYTHLTLPTNREV